MIDPEFDSVTATFRDSSVYRLALGLRRRFSVASGESVLLARTRTAFAAVAPRTHAHAVAGAALVLAWASLAHLAIRSMLPRYATSGLPVWWEIAFAIFAFATAALAPAIVTAWRDSTAATWTRRR